MQQRAARSNRQNAIRTSNLLLEGLPVLHLKRQLLLKFIICLIIYGIHYPPTWANAKELNERITAACPIIDYNVVANKQMITITSDFIPTSGSFAASLDGSTANAWYIPRYQDITNKNLVTFQFPSPTVLTGIEYVGGTFIRSNSTYKIQGSNDNTNWTDLTGVLAYSTSTSAPAYGAPSNSYKLPVTGNTGAYIYYRVYGVSNQTWYSYVDEFYFSTSQTNLSYLSNISCDANSTTYDPTDDYITFDLDPCGAANGATYNLSVSSGTVTPNTGIFGSVSSFRLQDGSAGLGDVTLTLSGFDDAMDVVRVITDPGDCGPEVCGGLNWNLPANKTGIISTATVTVDKGIQNLADGDLTTEISYKNATVVNKEIARFQFPSPAILMGIEFEAIAIFLNSGVQIRVDGSNDAVNWTDLSGTITTNGTLTAGQYGSTGQVQDFPFPSNTTAYTYYRLYGLAGSSIFSREIKDAFFKINVKEPNLANLTCNTNGTLFSAGDDYITFDLNPSPGTGTYSIIPSSGTITPSTATFGSTTSFRLQDGSAGAGDVTLTMYDLTEVCEFTQVIEDPGNCLPKDCGGTDWNLPTNKVGIISTATVTVDKGIQNLADGNLTTEISYKNATVVNKEIARFQFPSPAKLKGIEFEAIAIFLNNGVQIRVDGSNDAVNWTDLSGIITTNGTLTTGQYGSTGQVQDFPFPSNEDEYLYYRLYGLVGSSIFSREVKDAFFAYDVFDNNITNIGCDDSGTPIDFSDDKLTFDLNPSPGTGTYMVNISGGFTITPTSGTFGQVTSFEVSTGSSGAGDLTLTVIDASIPCVQEEIISNTKNLCLDTDLDGVQDRIDLDSDNDGILDSAETAYCNIDYSVLADRQMIEISATASTSGNITVLLDGNNNNNNFYYPDVSIANKEVVRIKFPKPTILTGIEYEIGNSYMFNTGATTIMQASNDGMTWTDVSSQYVKAANTNAPGTITSAPYTETFLWSNTTPYLYYRLYGISGNTNQNPWINELHFQTDNSICDFDEDGIENHLDLDSDNDGIPDNVEAQATNAYTPPANDNSTTYATNLGVNSAYLGGLTPPNTDSDSCPDYIDTDSDDDNKSDKSESGLVFNNVIGANGLDSGSETADDYSDPNGVVNTPVSDLAKSIPASIEVDYRRMALDFTATATQVTCNGPIANTDAKLTVNSPTGPAFKVGYSEGTVYTGPDYNTAATGGALPFDVATGLANPAYPIFYTIRVYTSAIVFDDYTVELQPKVCAQAELAVTMTPVATNAAFAGETVEYLVTLTNAGPDPGVDVKVKVDIPTETDFVSANASNGMYSSGSETWTIDLVPVGSETLTITYRLK